MRASVSAGIRLAAVGAVTLVSLLIGLVLGEVNLYLPAVMAAAVGFGRGPAIFASAVGIELCQPDGETTWVSAGEAAALAGLREARASAEPEAR